MLLGEPKLSGLTPVSATAPGTELARIPLGASQPAHLCIRNCDTAAIVYLKTVRLGEGGKVSSTDYGVVLIAGDSYDWGGCPARGVAILALSTVANSLVAVEANWGMDEEYR